MEVMLAIALLALISGASFSGMNYIKRLREEKALQLKLAAVDQAQLEFLRRFPGCSLKSNEASSFLPRILDGIEARAEQDPKITAIQNQWSVDIFQRPAKLTPKTGTGRS